MHNTFSNHSGRSRYYCFYFHFVKIHNPFYVLLNYKTPMKKIYYLSTCDTCKRIIKDLDLKNKGFTFQDIKTEKITALQLEEMKKLSGSYESLFSRIARKYKELGLS